MSGSRMDKSSHAVFAYPDSYYVSGVFEAEGFRLKALIVTLSVLVVLLVVLSVGPWSPWSGPVASSVAAMSATDTISATCTALTSSAMC